MARISVDLDVLRHALFDRSLSQVGDSLLSTKITDSVRAGDATLSPSGQLLVRVLNRPDDRDDDAVFGDAATMPHIVFDLQSAWVKYKLTAAANASVRLPVAFKGGGEIALADYRIHPATASAFGAMQDDLTAPRSILDLDDVRALKPGEALAIELGGSLSVAVPVSWSDILGTHLRTLLAGIPGDLPVAVKLKSGLSATAALRVTDRFSVVISRTPERHHRIAVKKAKSIDHRFGIDLDAGLDISAVEAVERELDPLFQQLAAAADRQPGREDEILAAVAALRKQLRGRLNELLRWKVMAGFAYEYARIDENTSIADYVLLDDSKLAGDYALALSGDFANVAEQLRGDTSARSLVRYLNETTLTRRSSFGFSLGIGKWLQVQAKESSAFTQSARTSLDGFVLITSKGTRRYEEKNIPQNDFEWIVDLKAQMKEFAETPSTLDFDFGLHYAVLLERAAISAADVERMLDFAAMWDVCVPDASMFVEAIGRKGTLRVQLLLDHDALKAAFAQPASPAQWAVPLAKAMPYMSTFAERRTHAARAEVYTNAWTAWLEGRDWSFRRSIGSGLILLEERGLPGSFAWTAGSGHPQLRMRLDEFVRGTQELYAAMATAQPPAAIGEAYDHLQRFWTQRLYIAASGRYLLDRAAAAGTSAKVSLQVEFADVTITS